jgi:uncharacterized protein
MRTPDPIAVSVVLAEPQRQFIVHLSLPPDATVADAVAQSGLIGKAESGEEGALTCAIYGRVVALSQPLTAGDRIEILRPLRMDPKERRRARARQTTPPRR